MRTCRKCKLEKSLSEFYPMKNDRYNYWCKACYAEYKTNNREKYRAYFSGYTKKNRTRLYKKREIYNSKHPEIMKTSRARYLQTPQGKYWTYIHGAKLRGLEFKITADEFESFWNKECFYCGDSIKTIGLDRIDNEIGYILENLVSCCTFCNRMKSSMSKDIFIEHCKKVANKFSEVIK